MKLKAEEGGEGEAHKDCLARLPAVRPCRTQYTEVVSLDP